MKQSVAAVYYGRNHLYLNSFDKCSVCNGKFIVPGEEFNKLICRLKEYEQPVFVKMVIKFKRKPLCEECATVLRSTL